MNLETICARNNVTNLPVELQADANGVLQVNNIGGGGTGGSVSVSNFPATQPVSGNVTATISGTPSVSATVNNFPSSQAVTNAGTFAVQNTAAIPAGSNLIGSVTSQAASGSITMSNSSVGATSATLLAASSASKMLTIQNTSASNTLYVSTTSPATSTNGIAIGAGVGYQFPYIPTNALYCLGSAASTTYTIWYA